MTTPTNAPMRTPMVKFDDMPGNLPQGSIPEGSDYGECADAAIAQLNNLTPDHFTSDAIWRDLLALTHTFRCFYSRDLVCSTLQTLVADKKITRFERTPSPPRFSGFNWIDVDFTFLTQHQDLAGPAAGTASCLQCPDGVWRIWMLRTWLECFDGHGHPDQAKTPPPPINEAIGQSTENPLGAIIVGGGQAGLSTAGRLQAVGVSYIVFEKTGHVGDVWRSRYDTLKIHTPKEYGPLPLGSRFPAEDPLMLPAKRMGDGHEAWAEDHHINVRTGTEATSAAYDDASRLWTVTTSSPEGKQIFIAKNLVLAIGPGLAQPVSPSWANSDRIKASGFQGEILHASKWKSAQPWAGKRGIVIGSANTGHDVAEDMANAGMNPTMIQRGPTFILPVEWLHAGFAHDYNIDKLTAQADRETATYPNKITREITNTIVHGLVKANAERFDAVERAGFQVDRYGDLYAYLFERFGGHYVDHGGSARIANGEIKVESRPVRGLYEDGLEFEDGSKLPADLIVTATGFNHDFRPEAARIIGQRSADRMDDYGGLDVEGEMRGFARPSGHPNLYYHGFETRSARWYSRFICLAIQADVIGRPLRPYTL